MSHEHGPPAPDQSGDAAAAGRERLRAAVERALDTMPETADAATPELSADERRELADVQFLHVLLERVHLPTPEEDESRITKAMQKLRTERSRSAGETELAPVRARKSFLRSASTLAAVAALLFVGFAVLMSLPSESAASVVQQAFAAAANKQDRAYRVTSQVRHPVRGLVSVDSTLYVRGSDRFALKHPAPLGPGTVWVGSNGQDVWFVPWLGPVLVDREGQLLDRLIDRRELTTPYLQITTILERLKDRYDLVLLPLEALPSRIEPGRSVTCRHIRGTLKADSQSDDAMLRLPESIDLWADKSSGIAMRLVLEWPEDAQRPGPQRIELELSELPDVADDWYDHAGHHAANRPVLPNRGAANPEEPAVIQRENSRN